MSAQQKRNKQLSEILKCGHCGNHAPMEIVATYKQDKTEIIDELEGSWAWVAEDNYEILLCPACAKPTIRCCYHDESMGQEEEIELLYPREDKAPFGLPSNIQSEYSAASRVRRLSPNAYAVLIRRVLEMVCIDRTANGKTLYDQLADLANKGEIPAKLVNVAKGLRELGNVGAHVGEGELTPTELPILDDLCKAILEYIYHAPLLAKQAEESLKKLKARNKKKGKIDV